LPPLDLSHPPIELDELDGARLHIEHLSARGGFVGRQNAVTDRLGDSSKSARQVGRGGQGRYRESDPGFPWWPATRQDQRTSRHVAFASFVDHSVEHTCGGFSSNAI
jgi:hypothetical protein